MTFKVTLHQRKGKESQGEGMACTKAWGHESVSGKKNLVILSGKTVLFFFFPPHLKACGRASQVAQVVKNPPANAGGTGDVDLIPGSGRSPRGGNSNPLQYSCLRNPVDRGGWQATVHGVTKSWTQLSTCTHDLCSPARNEPYVPCSGSMGS